MYIYIYLDSEKIYLNLKISINFEDRKIRSIRISFSENEKSIDSPARYENCICNFRLWHRTVISLASTYRRQMRASINRTTRLPQKRPGGISQGKTRPFRASPTCKLVYVRTREHCCFYRVARIANELLHARNRTSCPTIALPSLPGLEKLLSPVVPFKVQVARDICFILKGINGNNYLSSYTFDFNSLTLFTVIFFSIISFR